MQILKFPLSRSRSPLACHTRISKKPTQNPSQHCTGMWRLTKLPLFSEQAIFVSCRKAWDKAWSLQNISMTADCFGTASKRACPFAPHCCLSNALLL